MTRIASKAPAIVQSLIALLLFAFLLFLALLTQSGIDPREDIGFARSLWLATRFMGIPILWSTSAAILMWKRSAAGFWLSGILDLLLVILAAVALCGDIQSLPKMNSAVGAHATMGDAAIHLLFMLFCATGLFLAIRSGRARVSQAVRNSIGA